MPFHAQQKVVFGHATAVIADPNTSLSPGFNRDHYPVRSRVNAVVRQLPNHRGGPVYHLSGRDLGRQRFGEDSNGVHR
jgi:hypothetical protein